MGLLTENKKMKAASIRTYNWTLPAFKSSTGLITCPLAGQCGKDGGCYAQQGAYRWKPVAAKHEANLALTLDKSFVIKMHAEIAQKARSAAKQGKMIAIRIHDSGDFYNLAYTLDWFRIMLANPTVQFYAYTKMVPLFKRLQLTGQVPVNFVLIFSEGGKSDERIRPSVDRHSRVFGSLEELLEAGYTDATKNDTLAWQAYNHKIGLVYHGAKSKKWTTSTGNGR